MRVKGHTLAYEGAAFEVAPGLPNGIHRVQWNGVGGKGFARCSCGARSDALDTGQERKDWHRDHKREVVGR